MSNFEFVIPLHQDDLRRANNCYQYVVQEVFHKSELQEKLTDFQRLAKSNESDFIICCFDTLYSVLREFTGIREDMRQDAWKIILSGARLLEKDLYNFLNLDHPLDQIMCKKYCNILKMLCYLLCEFLAALARTFEQTSEVVSSTKKSRKTQPKDLLLWEEEKTVGVVTLHKLCQLNLHKLWDPPVVEEEFVSLITNCCFKLLESQNTTKNKATKNAVFDLLGVSLQKYKHTLGCSLKIIQLVQHFEHLISPLAQAIELFVNEYGARTILIEIIREISQMDVQDLVRDNTGTKSLSQFLIEVAERVPSAVLNSSSLLLPFLDEEPYSMRCGVLSMFGEVVVKVLSSDELDEKSKDLRDQMLDRLEDHIHDVNAFVRSKALQVWQYLCTKNAIPIHRQHCLLQAVIGRLQDKSSFVRKYAIQFVTAVIQGNPYAGMLAVEELEETLKIEEEKLNEILVEEEKNMQVKIKEKIDEWSTIEHYVLPAMKNFEDEIEKCKESEERDDWMIRIFSKIESTLQEEGKKGVSEFFHFAAEKWPKYWNSIVADEDNGKDNLKYYYRQIFNAIKEIYKEYLLAQHEESEAVDHSQNIRGSSEICNRINKQKISVKYIKDTLKFATEIQKALPIICELLHSHTNSDIQEAIRFFVAAHEFGIKDAIKGIKSMLFLIFTKEESIKGAVVSAYHQLYLSARTRDHRENALSVAKNIIGLVQECTLAEEICLDAMMKELVRSGSFNKNNIQILWDIFSMKIPNITKEESHAALKLLGMTAINENGILEQNLELLISVSFDSENIPDFRVVQNTCKMIVKLVDSSKVKNKEGKAPSRLHHSENTFAKLIEVLVKGVQKFDDHFWIPMAEQVVNVIYKLAIKPDALCCNILKQLADIVVNSSASDNCQTGVLQRVLFLAGHIALQQLLYQETYVFPKVKRHLMQEGKKQKGKRSFDSSRPEHSTKKKNEDMNDTKMTVDDGLSDVVGAADDTEIEYLRKVCETEMFSENNALGLLYPVVYEICRNPNKYPDVSLQAASTLTLAKFMMVSSTFCESNIQLLVTIMEKSLHPIIRGNMVVAFGDLAVRFPNVIEPWTSHLYNRLQDQSTEVKEKTLTVLTHLILHDIIKVKGQISDVALCIIDKKDHIAELAKAFFQELSKKGNAIYNILSDIISHLSDPECGTTESNFQTIMRYLFQFVEKEKQVESIVAKLCHRFRVTRTLEQARQLAFCLNLLSYNERSLVKLQENLGCLAEKLSDNVIYDHMLDILNGVKRQPNAKCKSKILLEELENQIRGLHNKETEESCQTVPQTPIPVGKTPRNRRTACNLVQKSTTRKSSRKRAPVVLLSSSEDDTDTE